LSELKFRYDVPVRFADLDLLGHVNHVAFIEILEAARVAYYQQILGMESVYEIGFVLAELRIRYLASGLLGQTLSVHFGVSWLGRSSAGFTFQIRERESGQLLAEGDGVQVHVDRRSGRPAPLPEVYRARIEAQEGQLGPPPER